MSMKDVYERDGDSSEQLDEDELKKLLLPEGMNDASCLWGGNPLIYAFSLSVNHQAFRSWVKQPSPCCCAASVAGALNVVLCQDRPNISSKDTEPRGFSCRDALIALHAIIRDQIREKSSAFSRRYGLGAGIPFERGECTPAWIVPDVFCGLTPLLDALYEKRRDLFNISPRSIAEVAEEAKASVLVAAGERRKRKRPTAASWFDACAAVVREVTATDNVDKREHPCFDNLVTLFDSADTSTMAANGEDDESSDDEDREIAVADDDVDTKAAADDTAPPRPPEAVAFEVPVGLPRKVKKKRPKWARDLICILKKTRGMIEVAPDAPRPSTYAFGNWGVLSAVKRFNDDTLDISTTVHARTFLGKGLIKSKSKSNRRPQGAVKKWSRRRIKKSKSCGTKYVTIAPSDSPADRSRQWASLRTMFEMPRTCIIFHLKNHYALVYAMRQFVVRDVGEAGGRGGSRIVREILTSRRGQRPKHWIAWEEAHATMCAYAGYKMICVECDRRDPSS